MIVDYKKLVHHIDDDPNSMPNTGTVRYGFEGLREIPSAGVTFKNEVLFPLIAGTLFGLGHF
jgi:hypothetical protein